jgi:hypothetical protein
MRFSWALSGAAAGLVLTSAVALAQPVLPACDSPEARSGVDFALKRSKAPFTITDYAGITTDRQTDTEVACLAIATLSNGSHRAIGYQFRIYNGKLQSRIGWLLPKGAQQ